MSIDITKKIMALRMERQCLSRRANEAEYLALYRDSQPGKNVYWDGFGDPPSLSFRADFDDVEYNRVRQANRRLLKGRFAGGNLGWVTAEDFGLFACLYNKPLDKLSHKQSQILELIERIGPVTIQQLKEETGLPVKEITPVLHRFQQAFMIYEDQYDGAWDRGWYTISEMFPELDLHKYTRREALKIILTRFAYRLVNFDTPMAKSVYSLPEKEISAAVSELTAEGVFAVFGGGWMLNSDVKLLEDYTAEPPRSVFALHANDVLVKAYSHTLNRFDADGRDILRYFLVDGELRGILTGKFRYGPNELEDIVTDLSENEAAARRDEILAATADLYGGRTPRYFMGEEII
jgi:hypothetical protein